MGETSKYHLYVTDDETTKFFDWREKMNGETNSNMTKIDEALSEKADKSVVKTAVLYASQWVGDTEPYSQRIEVDGLTETTNGVISIAQHSGAEERESARKSALFVTEQGDGYLVVVADKDKPDVDIHVSITIID